MADPKGNLVTPVGFRSDGSIHALELDDSDRLKTYSPIFTNSRGVGKVSITSNTALAAGTNTLSMAVVPASHVYVIKNIAVLYVGTVAGVKLRISFVIGGVTGTIKDFTPVVSTNTEYIPVDFALQPGDNVIMVVSGATLNDDAHLTVLYEDIS